MRNLKKVLSMVLAVSMMLSMMVFAGAAETKTETAPEKKIVASDLTDMAKVENKAEVALLVDLGIINGIKGADGTYTYAPTDGINRAAYSKMIYAMMLNKSNADVYKGTETGLKDVKGHWAEGFIAYCVSTKIAAGDTEKNFKPDDAIKTVTGAKMLLTALGYDATLSKYENDALWSINIMKDAEAAGILDGVNLGADEILTRDVAALMIFNAIDATKVTPIIDRDQGVAYLSKYEHSAKTLGEQVFGLYSIKTVVTAIDKDGVLTLADGATGTPKAVTDAANAAKIKGSVNMVGNTVVIYAKAPLTIAADGTRTYTYKSLYSTSVAPAPATVMGTSMNGTAFVDLSTKTDEDAFIASVDATKTTYYYNGAAVTNSTATTITMAQGYAATAGVIVTFLDTDITTAYADVVKIVKKSVGEVTGAPVTKTDKDGNVTVKVPGIGVTSASVKCEGYADLKKGDIVLYVNANGVVSFEKATSVEGKVTGLNAKGQVKVDGKFYGASGLVTSNPISGWKDYDNTFTFYFDNAGKIVMAKQLTDETVNEYLFVIETGWKSANGGLNGGKGSLEARIMNMDGTSEIVTVSKRGAKYVTDATVTEDATHEHYAAANFNNKFFTFKADQDGKYELTAVTTDATADAAVISSGTAVFTPGFVGNSSTLFLVKSGTTDAPIYTAYTGIANVPAMKLGATTKGYLTVKDGITTHVYLDAIGGKITGEAGEYIYVVNKSGKATFSYEYVPKAGSVPAHYLVEGIQNGAAVTLKTTAANTIASANVLYKVGEKDANGIITAVTAVTVGDADGNVQTGVKRVGDTLFLGQTTPETVSMDSSTEVFYISKDGVVTIDYTAIESDKNDFGFIAKKDGKGYAEIVYIIDFVSKDAKASATNSDCIATIGGTAVVGAKITGLTSWTVDATHDGTLAKPIVAAADVSVEIATADKDKAFTFTLKAVDPESTVSLYSGTMPATGAAAAATPLVFQVVAENGTTVLYYSINLVITNA